MVQQPKGTNTQEHQQEHGIQQSWDVFARGRSASIQPTRQPSCVFSQCGSLVQVYSIQSGEGSDFASALSITTTVVLQMRSSGRLQQRHD